MLTVLVVIGFAYSALVGYVYLKQEHLIYFPQFARELIATPAARGLPFEDVSIRTEDGETLSAWWIPADQPRGAALVLHGNAGNISHRIDYARMFRSFGLSTLLVDYRGYGKSTGSPSEEGTYRDALASWRWMVETRGIKPDEIVVLGESLGGPVACWIAALHTPRAVVLASTFTSVTDLGAEKYRLLPVRLLSRFKYDTRDCLSRVKAPVLIAHSPDDDIVPYAHGQALYVVAKEPKRFLELAGSHNNGLIYARPEWENVLREFLATHLR